VVATISHELIAVIEFALPRDTAESLTTHWISASQQNCEKRVAAIAATRNETEDVKLEQLYGGVGALA
jgi:hypothetical protein